ncbi:glycoside hydrolase family 2 protein [Opitutaceae bacterium TAV4]|nr:glycoside hydrolase family 2 protein [Opitutaceae bacterium TAV4]RRK01031.1 glycoside hydrolase family 2 protein [Opitutaceae bacterium TAV3]
MFRERPRGPWLPACVPGCVHTDLRAAGLIPDPFHGTNELDLQWIEERDWEYRTRFHVTPSFLAEEHVQLVADGLDTLATLYLNNRQVAVTDNMFTGHRLDIKSLLRPGTNELRLIFASALKTIRSIRLEHRPPESNDPVGRCTVLRKQQCQFGWDWGPRFVTAGIWRDIRLEAWSHNRLVNVRITQDHTDDGGAVTLTLIPELATAVPVTIEASVALNGRIVARASRSFLPTPACGTPAPLTLHITNPQLWWPAGQGAQPLYDIEITATNPAPSSPPGLKLTRRIGLRTITLDRSPDQWGECFRFLVNGRPIFIKGANWIPAHTFVACLTRRDYERDIRAASLAHMNLLRVWGGGIYESEDFYDLCDELGLLVWQDFMFACTPPPHDEAFLESVRTEAEQQVARLRHRASLALWCGNNEISQFTEALRDPAIKRGYEIIFHHLLPDVVARQDGITAYHPSSPWRGRFDTDHAEGEKRGDTHFWDVWHARHPVKDYEKWTFRFVSEFGMQSYSSSTTNATFCPPQDGNVFGPAMENHQKHRGGNQIILDYVACRYRFPKDQDALITLSQLNQAHCMQTGVEHYRRLMPRCMGSIYWQLNDCWPVASWSSIEFTGRWKALHHLARRFYAPALVSAHVPGDDHVSIGNYRRSNVDTVNLYTVYDSPAPTRGTLRWSLFHLDGTRLLTGRKSVRLRPLESMLQRTLRLAPHIARHGRDHLYLRIALDIGGSAVSEDTVLFSSPRFIPLPRAKTTVSLRLTSPQTARLIFHSSAFQHRFHFDFPGMDHTASDNFFELYPGEARRIDVSFRQPVTKSALLAVLRHQSLRDTYA